MPTNRSEISPNQLAISLLKQQEFNIRRDIATA